MKIKRKKILNGPMKESGKVNIIESLSFMDCLKIQILKRLKRLLPTVATLRVLTFSFVNGKIEQPFHFTNPTLQPIGIAKKLKPNSISIVREI